MIHIDQHQIALFEEIRKSRRNSGLSFAKEIGTLLNISNDSTYRRLRGETPLTLAELIKLNQTYDLKVINFLHDKKKSLIFSYNWPKPDKFNYIEFLKYILRDISHYAEEAESQIIFNAKDAPLFYNYLIPEISAFKGFFWEKTFLQKDGLKSEKFTLDLVNDEATDLGYQILKAYNNVFSLELWDDELINSTLKQILYFYESEIMDRATTATLLEKVALQVDHFQLQAERGCKFPLGENPPNGKENLQIYYNEVLIGDNNLLLKTPSHKLVFISQNIISNLVSADPMYYNHTCQLLENVMKRSTLITKSAEKERNKYFNRLREKIEDTRRKCFLEKE